MRKRPLNDAEIESVLAIDCAPISWPIGMGKRFRGVFHLLNDRLLRHLAGDGHTARELPDNAILTADSGSSADWYARFIQMRGSRRAVSKSTCMTARPVKSSGL